MSGNEPIGELRTINGVAFPPGMRFVIELVTLGVMLGGLYYALSGRIDIVSERVDTIRAGQASMEKSVKDVLTDHDKRLDGIEQGTAPVITDMKDQIKELKRSKQTKRGE